MKKGKPKFLSYKKIYVLPTYGGCIVLSLTFVSIVSATATGNNLLYLFTIFMSLFVLFTMIRAHQNINELEVTNFQSAPAMQGKNLIALYNLQNPRGDTRKDIQIETRNFRTIWDDRMGLACNNTVHRFSELKMIYQPASRGLYKSDSIRLKSTFPFGLWRAWSWHPQNINFIVYPEAFGNQKLRRCRNTDKKGDSHLLDGGDDFKETKPYKEGDNSRHIDWKSLARGRNLQVKIFTSGGLPMALVDIEDVSPTSTSGDPETDLETKLKQVSMWVNALKLQGRPFELRIGKLRCTVDNPLESKQFNECLKLISKYNGREYAA